MVFIQSSDTSTENKRDAKELSAIFDLYILG